MKVLVLGAGGAAPNGFARALKLAGGYELVGTNCSETDLLLSECDENHLVAHVDDFDQWRVDLDRLLREARPAFVHAQNDAEVEALGRCRTLVHGLGAKTWLPSQDVIGLCRDKWESYRAWKAAGITVPYTELCATRDSIFGLFDGSAWLRPRTGAGGQKSFAATSSDEAVWWIDRNDGWGDFTIAEQLTPVSVTVQQLYWQGKLVVSQQRRRASWANAGSTTTGVSGSTGVGVTASDREPDRVADLAVAAIDPKPHGLYGIDMTYDRHGTPCPTEINVGRFFTTVPEFCAQAGFNFADYFVRQGENAYYMRDQGFGNTCPSPVHRNPLPDGVRWIRTMDRAPVLA